MRARRGMATIGLAAALVGAGCGNNEAPVSHSGILIPLEAYEGQQTKVECINQPQTIDLNTGAKLGLAAIASLNEQGVIAIDAEALSFRMLNIAIDRAADGQLQVGGEDIRICSMDTDSNNNADYIIAGDAAEEVLSIVPATNVAIFTSPQN